MNAGRYPALLAVVALILGAGTAAGGPETSGPSEGPALPGSPVSDPFPVPPGLEPRVAFWVDIYTRYTTRQAVVHDSELPQVVYGVVDLGGVADGGLTEGSADREMIRLAGERVRSILFKLQSLGDDLSTLSDEERLVYNALSGVAGEDRYRRAADRVHVQRGQADRFRAGLIRSGLYLEAFRGIARSEGVPEDLAYLPHVESSFQIGARSHVGAAGMWQFMRDTGRRFLVIDWARDERYDPWFSARAAFRLLRENRELLGSWPLAITAYNHGQGGMLRARELLGDDFMALIDNYDGRGFGFASRSFYAEFLAARRIARDPEPWFGTLTTQPSLQFTHFPVPVPTSARALSAHFEVDVEDLRALNPALHPDVWTGSRHIPQGYALRVPLAGRAEGASPVLPISRITRPAAPGRPEEGSGWHSVQAGETLFAISRRYGTSVGRLRVLNRLGPDEPILAGQRLRVEGREPLSTQAATGPDTGGWIRHVVRRGETLAQIAVRYGTALSRVVMANGLEDASRIRAGQVLLIPAP